MNLRVDLLVRPRLVAGLLCTLTAIAYANSLAGVPQFDDYAVILDEPRVASLAAWWESMPGMRPLLKLSYALNRQAGGLAGFHLTNIAIHLGCVLLAWRLLLVLLPAQRARSAALGALLFALHPVATEAVTLLSGRSVALASLAMIGSLLALVKARAAMSLLLFVLALAVRESSLVLPALATLSLAWLHARRGAGPDAWPAAVREARWHWLIAALGVAVMLGLPRYRELLAFSLEIRSPAANLVTQTGAVSWLLGQLLRPFALNADPRLAVFAGWDLRWALLCTSWLALIVWAALHVRRGSWLAFALAWFVLALLPTNSIVPRLDLANERQLYLAALPLYAGVGLVWEGTWPTQLRIPAVLVAILLAATVLRNRDYHSETAFWNSVLARDAGNARAWNNLGFALERERPGDPAGAVAAYRRAAALDPEDYKSRHNLRRLCSRPESGSFCGGTGGAARL